MPRALGLGDVAAGEGGLERGAGGVAGLGKAEGEDRVALLELLPRRRREHHGRAFQFRDVEDGEIELLVAPDPRGLEAARPLAVGNDDRERLDPVGHLAGDVDDVMVGDDIALVVEHEAGAVDAENLLALIGEYVLDAHHAAVELLHVERGGIRAGHEHGRGGDGTKAAQ